MNELTFAVGVILFLCGWYGMSKVAGRWLRRLQDSRVVWCAKMKTFSLVEPKIPSAKRGTGGEIGHCLLWPQYRDCDHCIQVKTPGQSKQVAEPSTTR
jgi:hypothetical protein